MVGHAVLVLAVSDAAAIGIGLAGLVVGVVAGIVAIRSISGRSLANATKESQSLLSRAKDEARVITEKAAVDADKLVLERKEKFDSETEAVRRELDSLRSEK
jgi:cell division septum initiation protein DivIVA